MRRDAFTHEFVEFMPAELQEGVLYISMPYATAKHLCACGCGNQVVTPLSPADWQLYYDGDTVSLTPSIGNGQFPCRSHYLLEAGEVLWLRPMTQAAAAAVQRRDVRDHQRYFARRSGTGGAPEQPDVAAQQEQRPRIGRLAKVRRRFSR